MMFGFSARFFITQSNSFASETFSLRSHLPFTDGGHFYLIVPVCLIILAYVHYHLFSLSPTNIVPFLVPSSLLLIIIATIILLITDDSSFFVCLLSHCARLADRLQSKYCVSLVWAHVQDDRSLTAKAKFVCLFSFSPFCFFRDPKHVSRNPFKMSRCGPVSRQ